MRLGVVAALTVALAGCGGADDSAFGGEAADAGASVHYGPHGLPFCETTCGDDHQAVCLVPGKSKAELVDMYTVIETIPHGKYEPIRKVLTPAYEDGRVVAWCHNPGDAVQFRSG